VIVFPLLGALLLVYGVGVRAYARGLLFPPRMNDGKALARLGRMTPADLGMAFDGESYPRGDRGRDGERQVTPAWWVPLEGARRTAVLCHGYADAKVGALAWGPLFRAAGYNLLLPDMRGHGASPEGPMTAGVREAEDLAALLAELAARHAGRAEEVVLFGASLGSAAVARVMSEGAFAGETTAVRGVVLDSPPVSFRAGCAAHARLMNLPGGWLTGPGVWVAEKWAGVEFGVAGVGVCLPKLRVPALVILPTEDTFIQPADREVLKAAFEVHRGAHPPAELWEPGTPHLLAIAREPEEYGRRVARLARER
jgi:pimeloyl-ACP methyl ester carboxylesterase